MEYAKRKCEIKMNKNRNYSFLVHFNQSIVTSIQFDYVNKERQCQKK